MTGEHLFKTKEDRAGETARLNDLARTAPPRVNASWVMTRGLRPGRRGRAPWR